MTNYVVLKGRDSDEWFVDRIDPHDTASWVPNMQVAQPTKNTLRAAYRLMNKLNQRDIEYNKAVDAAAGRGGY